MKDSIISNDERCFICGCPVGLHRHHCFHGTSNRKLAHQDGCWVNLCFVHHTGMDGVHNNRPLDVMLMKFAQMVWESKLGDREAFRRRYGKSYL